MDGHLYDYHLYEWSSACDYWLYEQLYVCLAIRVCTEYVLDIQSFFFITQKKNIFLLYYPSAQINHIYDVYGYVYFFII